MAKRILDTKYNPKDIEDKIYEKWLDNKCFLAKVNKDKKPFTIVMPPPNITGKLHMGHALDCAIQDTIIRYKKMCGYEALWQPGTDHAAISTEVKVVDRLRQKGIDKRDLGREGFLKEAWAWKEEFEKNIINQQRKLGIAADWDKLRFTMDEGCSKAVLKVFCDLYNKGLIYKGKKIINWCPKCHTTISDAEVIHEEQQGKFYYLKYFIASDTEDVPNKNGDYLTVATTRPETLLGDTAVCVNPEDDRYKHLIGKNVFIPLINKKIPVVADEHADMEFGSGVVKITPAHDPNDFEVGLRHNLEQICILTDDAKIDCKDTPYHGLDRYDARKKMVEDLDAQGFLIKIEDHVHNVGTHDRCNTTIEPMIKEQWFVKMHDLAIPAIEVLKNKSLQFVPENYGATYLHWLENIKDWCISRQIWWGHRIPAYYCPDCGKMIVTDEYYGKKLSDISCPHCGSKKMYQDEDTLDTWFSSALWPFSTLGWPEETENYKYFYPTDVLVTGYDIIFFWVVRMVFSALENTKSIPFHHVLIHGIVRDDKGRKMSKSLGNGIDPLDVISEYGADALRIALLTGNAPGNDMRFYRERVENGRNFLNKIWNASRFIQMNDTEDVEESFDFKTEDKWILSKMNTLNKEVRRNLESYDLGIALDKIQKFIWEEFCDWYIEIAKPRLYSNIDKNSCMSVLKIVLNNSLKLLHPFCPFVTEEIFENFNDDKILLMQDFPEFDDKFDFKNEENDFEYIKDCIVKVRAKRTELNVPQKKKSKIFIQTKDEKIKNIFSNCITYIKTLAYAEEVDFIEDEPNNKNMVSIVLDKANIFIPLEELVNMDEEKEKIKTEIERMKKEIERSNSMLSNEKFMSKAPKEKIKEEEDKLEKYKNMLSDLEKKLASF